MAGGLPARDQLYALGLLAIDDAADVLGGFYRPVAMVPLRLCGLVDLPSDLAVGYLLQLDRPQRLARDSTLPCVDGSFLHR